MQISISSSIFNDYPETNIGYMIAEVKVESEHPYVESLKKTLFNQLKVKGITQENLIRHTHINSWRNIYRNFGIKPSKFQSSIEALVRRIIKGKELWQISSVVDLYNCVSVLTLLPIGGYDLAKIDGDIFLRYGSAQDVFLPLGSSDTVSVNEKQIVYADNNKIICYLWNYKDSRLSAIDFDTKKAIFFLDAAFIPQICSMTEAVKCLNKHLTGIQGVELVSGMLNINNISIQI